MTQERLNRKLEQLLSNVELLPVVTVADTDDALRLAEKLQNSGLNAVEITLRTDAALQSLSAVKSAFPDLTVAAGTVVNAEQMQAVADAGVDFAVSPGMTRELVDASLQANLPYLPGVATPSEMLVAGELGFCYLKLFPAMSVGGLSLLKSIAAPLPQFKFCPTGGLNEGNYEEFLALPNVVCVGGSWMVPA